MASPEEMGAYYEAFPNPDDPATWGGAESFEDAKASFEAAKGPAPSPSPVPGPPSPGAGMPAARIADLCAHGGAIIGPGEPTVLIGFMPAVRAMPAMDTAACPMFDGLIPHVSGTILKGSNSVLIGMFPAARVSDPLGPPANCKGNAIAKGEPTVLIGDSGAGGGGPSAASMAEAQAAAAAAAEAEAMADQAASTEAALAQAAAAGTPLVQMAPPCQRVQEAAQETKHAIAFQVVLDATNEPIAGVQLKVTLPDGTVETHATDGAGRVVIDDLEQPGVCSVTCDLKGARPSRTYDFVAMGEARVLPPGAIDSTATPASRTLSGGVIAEIEEHKVKTGESIKSLAVANGMTWQDLAIFNWGTSVPDEINKHLAEEVGCTKKTRDGYNYMFDDSDDPGIVFIPRKWAQTGLATDQQHTIRVRRIQAGVTLQFTLRSETTGHLLPFHEYSVYDEGGGLVTQDKTDDMGEGRAKVDRAGVYEVVPGIPRTYSVSGKVHWLKHSDPLSNADVEVRPWQLEPYTVQTGPKGEISLENVPHGELILSHQGAEYSVYVDRPIMRGFFFIPRQQEGPPFEEGNQELNV